MRYLVVDAFNEKLIGVFALGDPVFNLRARDSWLGWDVEQRRRRLVDVMDAFILGSVPPYSSLLGGKVVASLIGSAEVTAAFEEKYNRTTGIISKEAKHARLALVTVTSALGRSSIYNRLVLHKDPDDPKSEVLVRLERIGETSGFGHFQLSDELFARLRSVLRAAEHPYAKEHQYGKGPNWRMRAIRVGLDMLGLDQDLLRHGIAREVFAMRIADNAREYLKGEASEPKIDRPTAATIGAAARSRWIIPRAERSPGYELFARDDLLALLGIAG
jgi:hypothetical protein